jgi:hypothetical protein
VSEPWFAERRHIWYPLHLKFVILINIELKRMNLILVLALHLDPSSNNDFLMKLSVDQDRVEAQVPNRSATLRPFDFIVRLSILEQVKFARGFQPESNDCWISVLISRKKGKERDRRGVCGSLLFENIGHLTVDGARIWVQTIGR